MFAVILFRDNEFSVLRLLGSAAKECLVTPEDNKNELENN